MYSIGDVVVINNAKSCFNGLHGKIISFDEKLKIYTIETKVAKLGIKGRYLKNV